MSTSPASAAPARGLVTRAAGAPDLRRRLSCVVGGLAATAGAIVLIVLTIAAGAIAGILAGVVVAVAVAAGAWFAGVAPRLDRAEERVASKLGVSATLLSESDGAAAARLLNLVEGMAPSAGLPRPRCLLLDDAAVNAAAIGRDERHGWVVVTTGLLERLSRMELEGVVGLCLTRLRDGRTARPTVALAFGRPVTAPSPEELIAGDLTAVRLTRYPPGLAAALRSIAAARTTGADDVPVGGDTGLAALWIVPPAGAGALETRIAALEQL